MFQAISGIKLYQVHQGHSYQFWKSKMVLEKRNFFYPVFKVWTTNWPAMTWQTHRCDVYQEVLQFFLCSDWVGSNGILYLMYGISSMRNTAKWYKTHIDETLSYCNVKYTPRVPLILLTAKKIKCGKFDFWVCCSSSFFLCPQA